MTSPDPTLPAEGTPPRRAVAREVIGLLLMVVGLVTLAVIAVEVYGTRMAVFVGALVLVFIGWRLTVAEE